MRKEGTTKKLTLLGLCTALALVLGYVESLIPPLGAVPGMKMGLPNIVVLFVLYRLGGKEAWTVSLLRLVLSAALFGSFVSFLYSLSGAILSLTGMCLLKKWDKFSLIGVSVAGGVLHNAGQILMAMALLDSTLIAAYLPVLAVSGVVAGVAVGVMAGILIKRLNKLPL